LAPAQLSETAGSAKLTRTLVSIGDAVTAVMSPGQVIVGGCESRTVTLNRQLASAEVHTTAVVPIGRNDPEGGLKSTSPQLPETTGAGKLTVAPHMPGMLCTFMSPEHERT